MRRSRHHFLTYTAMALVALPAAASAVITVTWRPVSINSAAIASEPTLANMQSWDILVVTDGNWGAAGMCATLTAGQTFYKNLLGTNTKPNPALFSAFPALEFTTYVTAPADTGATGTPVVLGAFPAGGPASLGSANSPSPGTFSMLWGENVLDEPGTYQIARLTFPNNSVPSIDFDSYAATTNPTSAHFQPHLGAPVTWPIVRWQPDADGDWNVPANWSSNALPRTQQRIELDVGGATVRTITHASGTTALHELRNFERIVLSGGTISTYVTEINGELSVAGGTFRPLGFHHLTGTGVVDVGNNGTVLLNDSTVLELGPGLTLRGSGGVVHSQPQGALFVSNAARVVANAPGGLSINGVSAHLRTGSVVAGDGAVRFTGLVRITGNTTKTGAGPLRVNGTLTIEGNVDFSGGGMINDYTGPSPLPGIRGKIVSGYSNNTWTGNGIHSAAAAADDNLAVGYAEASELFASFPAGFLGESVDATSVLVRLVRNGDADLSGTVNLADFNRLAGSFGSTNALWDDGDFNYDGNVNLTDFNLLAANFGQSAAGSTVSPEDWSNLASAVPEPGALMPVVGIAALARRRRSC